MEWVSPEVQQFYIMFNKVYTTIVMNHHPYISLLYVDPYTFNKTFTSEDKYHFNDVNIIVCTSFDSDEYIDISKNRSLGEDISVIFTDLQKMVPGNEVLNGKKMYAIGEINKTKYCKGIVKYHYE